MSIDAGRHLETDLFFEQVVFESFSFLQEMGFKVAEQCSTQVRYLCKNVEVEIYHGRQSHEVGVRVSINGEWFLLSDLIRLVDSSTANAYRNPVATDARGMVSAATQVASLLKQFGAGALCGDARVVDALSVQRRLRLDTFAMEMLDDQIRPLAEHAFKSGDYSTAAKLYARIRARLSPVEARRLALSESRSVKH
jgi:hypothetical protein